MITLRTARQVGDFILVEVCRDCRRVIEHNRDEFDEMVYTALTPTGEPVELAPDRDERIFSTMLAGLLVLGGFVLGVLARAFVL